MARNVKQPRRRWWAVAARPQTGAPPPLDIVSGAAAAAYSYRRLRSAYAGPILNVRRSSDSTAQNVGLSGSYFDAAGFSSFVGGGTGFNTQWFDQSANANHAVQATAANQLSIALGSGSRYANKGGAAGALWLAAPAAASINDIWQGNAADGGFALFVVSELTNPGTISAICGKSNTGWSVYGYPGGGATTLIEQQHGSAGDAIWGSGVPIFGPPNLHVLTILYNATPANVPPTMTLDGVVTTLATSSGFGGAYVSDAGNPLILHNGTLVGGLAASFYDFIYEMIFFKSPPGAADQAALIANARTFYGTA